MAFSPGDRIIYRGIHVTDSGAEPPVVADLKPAIVAQDTPELVAFWVLAGTPTKVSRPIDRQQPKPWSRGEWELVDAVWSRWNALFLIEPEAWHATWVWWTPEWDFLGWYVNMQEPFVRTADGFDHRDLQLDIVVKPDRSWRWKDEADLSRSSRRASIRTPSRLPGRGQSPPGSPCPNPDARVRLRCAPALRRVPHPIADVVGVPAHVPVRGRAGRGHPDRAVVRARVRGVRSRRGHHRDLQLDIVVQPDRSWRWKDEHDLARSVETGVISAETAARTRMEAERLIPLIEAAAGPFETEMASRRPDRLWLPAIG